MYTIHEGIEKIRSLASAWLTDQTTDGSTAMGEVTATLLNTNFEQYTNEMEVRGPSTEELAAEIDSLLGRLETAKSIGIDACDQLIANRQEQTPALRDVAAERLRQVSVEGRSQEEDAQYTNGELADAAGCYVMHVNETQDDLEAEGIPAFWPWEAKWWKPTDRRRNLVKAGALILAEIERLDRAEEAKKPANWDRTKPEWSSHDWPQIFQTSNGNWFGVRAGWDLKAHTSSGWKGDEVSLLSDDGKFLKYGKPSPDWRDSLEQRPAAELYTAADEARMDVVGQNGNDGEHYEALPIGLTWAKAPEWADALVEADANNTDVPDRVLVWVSATNQRVDGELATASMGRKAGTRQSVSMDHPASVWTVVATRPAPVDDGWIDWAGELCPAEDFDAMVWVRLEGEDPDMYRAGFAADWDWRIEPALGRSRIVAYSLTDPSVKP